MTKEKLIEIIEHHLVHEDDVGMIESLKDGNLVLYGCGENQTEFVVIVEQFEGLISDAYEKIKNSKMCKS